METQTKFSGFAIKLDFISQSPFMCGMTLLIDLGRPHEPSVDTLSFQKFCVRYFTVLKQDLLFKTAFYIRNALKIRNQLVASVCILLYKGSICCSKKTKQKKQQINEQTEQISSEVQMLTLVAYSQQPFLPVMISDNVNQIPFKSRNSSLFAHYLVILEQFQNQTSKHLFF